MGCWEFPAANFKQHRIDLLLTIKLPVRSVAKHAVLVMVDTSEADVEKAVISLLQTKGWPEPAIQRLKLLNQPFHTDDSIMQSCYDDEMERVGGIVVYSDPIPDA